MPTMTLTAKRQATLPLETCRSLGLQPGDVVELVARDGADGREWVLRPRPARVRKWLGRLEAHGRKTDAHSMESIRASIAAGRKRRGAE
jgi:bifunctional DNA-binding transcriptional regulator/antitoxin component of YhaV-PrlF toxin-antitoxin module